MIMTHRARLLKVASGEMVEVIPWIPRIDLWHNAHAVAQGLGIACSSQKNFRFI